MDGLVDVMITIGYVACRAGLWFESLSIDHEIEHFASEHNI